VGRRSASEKNEFTSRLIGLVRNDYLIVLRRIPGYDIDCVGEEPADSGAVIVKIRARTKPQDPRAQPFEADFKMLRKNNGQWLPPPTPGPVRKPSHGPKKQFPSSFGEWCRTNRTAGEVSKRESIGF
jgi:hypothetical protein